jgi:AcrR family transcriptional regulator
MSEHRPAARPVCVRDRIIGAAVELLHECGFNALTQARVSALAGVRQSHLTYYFPTRTDLLKQAVLAGVASLLDVLEGPPGEQAQSLNEFRDALAAQISDRRVPRMMAGLVVASEEDPSLKRWLERFESALCERLSGALRARGLRPKRSAVELFQATVVGALHLDLAASSAASRRRTQAILTSAFAQLVAGSATLETAPTPHHSRSIRSVTTRPR